MQSLLDKAVQDEYSYQYDLNGWIVSPMIYLTTIQILMISLLRRIIISIVNAFV